MIACAKLNYVRITPRKFRQIVPLIKGKSPETAIEILMTVKKNACNYAIALIKSAVANAKKKEADSANLYISNMIANPGPVLKRFRAASMGRAGMIRKRTSHLIVELDVRAESAAKKAVSKAPKAKKAVEPKAEAPKAQKPKTKKVK